MSADHWHLLTTAGAAILPVKAYVVLRFRLALPSTPVLTEALATVHLLVLLPRLLLLCLPGRPLIVR
jgi:hypothetical protein